MLFGESQLYRELTGVGPASRSDREVAVIVDQLVDLTDGVRTRAAREARPTRWTQDAVVHVAEAMAASAVEDAVVGLARVAKRLGAFIQRPAPEAPEAEDDSDPYKQALLERFAELERADRRRDR